MLTADEGRSKLRKASGRRKRSLIRGYPNGETRLEEFRHSCKGGEPGEVKHLSSPRRRNRRDSLSSGERKGISLNLLDVRGVRNVHFSRTVLGKRAVVGDSPVGERVCAPLV